MKDYLVYVELNGIWTGRNKTQIPDFYVNANDVLMIKPIKGEEWPKQDFC